ncbi:MAG: type II toxin-antitoxin system YafQ family toxin [Erysipelotrichaceae bacterium]|nr:type II toxin-antitoxin system YafQ family toxin [Erysipelotrichaceae bacterium]
MNLKTTSQFRKDYKRCRRQGKDMRLLKNVIDELLTGKVLDPRTHDHALSGDHIGFRECHIQPDWLLIYKIDKGSLILTAVRTGSHADLLKL